MVTPAGAHGGNIHDSFIRCDRCDALFLAGIVVDRTRQANLSGLGGDDGTMPIYRSFSIVAFLIMAGVPTLCTFVGEFLVLIGTFQAAAPDSSLLLRRCAGYR